jgi:hypothetical protein
MQFWLSGPGYANRNLWLGAGKKGGETGVNQFHAIHNEQSWWSGWLLPPAVGFVAGLEPDLDHIWTI